MNLDYIEECASILTNRFAKNNKVWNTLYSDYNAVYQFMYDKIKESLEWQEELRENGAFTKDFFINFVHLITLRYPSTKTER